MKINQLLVHISFTLIGLWSAASFAIAAEGTKFFNIEQQPLATALNEFAQQSDRQILFSTEVVDTKRTDGIKGELQPEVALKQILKGTGLSFRVTTDETILVDKPGATANVPVPPNSMRLAQGSGSAEPSSPSEEQRASRDSSKNPEIQQIDEVVVTGTHIRGSQPAGAKLIVIDREMIDSSGYGRVQDVLGTLTQNFGGIGEAPLESIGVFNPNRGAEVQLRGLGPGTTLTLVNGRRQAVGGQRGSVIDISSIAASAVERIEVLPDGASALYGSDAIGGVVNIVLRKDFEGFESRLRTGTAGGEADELQFAQLWGTSWSSGRVLLGYQYDEREALPAAARRYSAANNDYRAFGGSDFRTLGSNPGEVLNSAFQPTHAIPAGQDGINLTADQLIPGVINYADRVTFGSVLPSQQMHTAFLSTSYDITHNWEWFLDGRYGKRDFELVSPGVQQNLTVQPTNAFNHIGGTVRVAYDFTDDLGPRVSSGPTETHSATTGITGQLPGQWQLKLSGGHAEERNSLYVTNGVNSTALAQYLNGSGAGSVTTALNVFGDGSHTAPATLEALRLTNFEQSVWTTSSANVIADGPLFDVPAGAIRLAVGGDYRREHLTHINPSSSINRSVRRDVSAVFAELAIPAGAGLELSLAGRYEDYDDFGTTFDPKVGVSWQPASFVKLRGTWGTSFRAPPFYLSNPQFRASTAAVRNVTDPLANGQSQVLIVGGAHPDITEETADVWTAGIDLALPAIENLSLSLSFFDIDYQGKIQIPASTTTYLTQEALFAPLIQRNPTADQIADICGNPNFIISGSCTGTFAAILDGRSRNLASVQTRGLDASLDYSLATSLGRWGFGLSGTYTFDYQTRLIETAPALEAVDTLNNPLALRLSGHLSWGLRGWTARATVNHSGSYKNLGTIPIDKVDAWTTIDLNLGYRFDEQHGWLGNTQFHLGAINVFDKEPPFVDQSFAFGYDGINASLLGRQVSLQVVKEW